MPAFTTALWARSRPVGLLAVGLAALGSMIPVARGSNIQGEVIRQQATTTRTTHLSETAHLHLVAHQGTQTLQEEGQASGTLRGRLTAVINIGYTEATVTFTARSSAGTLSGRGVESYYVSGKNGHFIGRMSVTGGTRAYAHASGSSLQTVGLIKRGHYEVQMTISGELRG
jgi:hypothetical protein